MKKTIFAIIILLIICTYALFGKTDNTDLTIGAILPLSGPAAIWGENVQKGITLALEGKMGISVVYEDSKGKPADGVTAFKNLQTKNVDIMLSALSAVSIPVSKQAQETKTPLLATLTAADGIVNDYTVRYYSNASNFASPAFTDQNSPITNAKTIAVLYRNDDLGKSVFSHIEKLADEQGKQIVIVESFNPGEIDFNQLVTKIKGRNPDVLLFVPVTPGEATGIVQSARALSFTKPLVEASNVFADLKTREQVSGSAYGTNVYTFIHSTDSEVIKFKDMYKNRYGDEPNFAVAFGYDVANLLHQCKDSQDDILTCIKMNKTYSGVSGLATQISSGDFNVPMVFDSVR